VGDHHVRAPCFVVAQRGLERLGSIGLSTVAAQQQSERLPRVFVVVDQEHTDTVELIARRRGQALSPLLVACGGQQWQFDRERGTAIQSFTVRAYSSFVFL